MTWLGYLALVVIANAIASILMRVLMGRVRLQPATYVVLFQSGVGIVMTCAALINGWRLPDFSVHAIPMLITIVLYSVTHLLNGQFLRTNPASSSSMYLATGTIWIAALGVIVRGETLTPRQISGIIAILAGAAIVSQRSLRLALDANLQKGVLIGILYGLATFSWLSVAMSSDTLTWNAIAFLGPAAFMLVANPTARVGLARIQWKPALWRIGLLCSVYSIGSYSLLRAFQLGDAGITSGLSQLAIPLIVLLETLILRERNDVFRKLVASVICAAGAAAIVMS